MADREYKDINAIAAEMKPMPTPCELAAENDRLMQKVSALCKERDELKRDNERLRRALDQTVVKLNDETVRAERLEAENRAKEQYIAETIGKLARERDAAIEDVKKNWICAACKKGKDGHEWVGCSERRLEQVGDYSATCVNFEWRGVQEREER